MVQRIWQICFINFMRDDVRTTRAKCFRFEKKLIGPHPDATTAELITYK